MRIGVSYSGITGRNGADFVARFLWRAAVQEGHQVVMLGSEGGPQATEIPDGLHCIVHSSGYALTPELVEAWKKKTRVFLWTHNDCIGFWQDRIRPISQLVDKHFSYSRAQPFGGHVEHLPLAADDSIYHKLDVQKKFDIAMVGAGHRNRVLFAEKLGERFQNHVYNFNMSLSDEEVNSLYNLTRVVIGPQQDADQYLGGVPCWGAPCRTYDVPAAGAFHLQVQRDSLMELFSNKTNLGMSTVRHIPDMDQAVSVWADRVDMLLHAETWREECAASMCEEIRSRHTYRHRLRRMLEFL